MERAPTNDPGSPRGAPDWPDIALVDTAGRGAHGLVLRIRTSRPEGTQARLDNALAAWVPREGHRRDAPPGVGAGLAERRTIPITGATADALAAGGASPSEQATDDLRSALGGRFPVAVGALRRRLDDDTDAFELEIETAGEPHPDWPHLDHAAHAVERRATRASGAPRAIDDLVAWGGARAEPRTTARWTLTPEHAERLEALASTAGWDLALAVRALGWYPDGPPHGHGPTNGADSTPNTRLRRLLRAFALGAGAAGAAVWLASTGPTANAAAVVLAALGAQAWETARLEPRLTRLITAGYAAEALAYCLAILAAGTIGTWLGGPGTGAIATGAAWAAVRIQPPTRIGDGARGPRGGPLRGR